MMSQHDRKDGERKKKRVKTPLNGVYVCVCVLTSFARRVW